MNIGFDAKRAYHNATGLGNYSRTLIQSLASIYTNEKYFLFNPTKGNYFNPTNINIKEINPSGFINSLFPSLWRSKLMVKDIDKYVSHYHGLSNELPFGIHKSNVKKIVTIHDLIFEHFPEQYRKNDILIYRKKFKYACQYADKIIAISESTKQDLIDIYAIGKEKIEVCYQSCNERFFTNASENQKLQVKEKYNLHTPYFLSVGSIIERKNLLTICKAFYELKLEQDIKLIIVGKGNNEYKQTVLNFINEKKLDDNIIFLEDKFHSVEIYNDLPILYQNAIALVYPSIMEGFGIPVLEAMVSATAVITSNVSSMPEIAKDVAQCIHPNNINELYIAMNKILTNDKLRNESIKKGLEKAQQFSHKNTCEKVMNLYKQLN